MIVTNTYLSSLCHVLVGVCNLPNPDLYLLYDGELELLEGSGTSFIGTEFLQRFNSIEKSEVYNFTSSNLKQQPFQFVLSVKLEKKYNLDTYLLLVDSTASSLNDGQLLAIQIAKRNYLNNLEREKLLKEIKRQSAGLQLLNDIDSYDYADLSSRLEAGLKLTNDYFGLEGGVISEIHENIYKVVSIFPDHLGLKKEEELPLETTYSEIALNAPGPIAIDHMGESKYSTHQCYQQFAQESYIGATYKTENFKGTVSFGSKAIRKNPFSKYDLEFVELFAKWVGRMIEVNYKQQNLRDTYHVLYSFVHSSPAAIAMFDKNLKYLAVSDKWLEDYGITRDIIGVSHYEIFPEIGVQWKEYHQLALSGKYLKKEEEKFERADGSIQWIKWDLRPWFEPNNEIGGIVIFTDDISAHIEQKQKLSIAKQATEKAANIKEQFTYIASHDLQEPVRTITSLSQLVQKNYKDKLDARGQKMIDYILSSANRMNLLINGLLDFSRIGKNKVLQNINLNKLVSQVQSDLSLMINEREAKIIVENLPVIPVYQIEVRLLFQNLISNAIKYAKTDEKPLIHISCEDTGKYYKIKVSDNGIGIPVNKSKKIFQIFQQLADRENQVGLGIGLANCYRIVEIHHGDIWVEPNPKGGSDFYFTLLKNLDKLDLNI